jgi:hypothetical protein
MIYTYTQHYSWHLHFLWCIISFWIYIEEVWIILIFMSQVSVNNFWVCSRQYESPHFSNFIIKNILKILIKKEILKKKVCHIFDIFCNLGPF